MGDIYTEKEGETPSQRRFRIFAMTHKEPTRAADEWLADKERIDALTVELYEANIELYNNDLHVEKPKPKPKPQPEDWEIQVTVKAEPQAEE